MFRPEMSMKIEKKNRKREKKDLRKSTGEIAPAMSVLPCRYSHIPSRSRHVRVFSTRSSLLPFPEENARFHRQLSVAIDTVQRACSLCVDVKKTLISNNNQVLQKMDDTPVTIADFSVQALISLELKRHFPYIPLVAEEDSNFLRSNYQGQNGNILINSIFNTVCGKMDDQDLILKSDDVLKAIDRGGKDSVSFNENPATYWVLDPIDGTRGFLKGNDALYVVGLSLIFQGEVVLGVMGCPNWKNNPEKTKNDENAKNGIIMISHLGFGTWTKTLSLDKKGNSVNTKKNIWKRSFVDNCSVVRNARFCIPESQNWDLIPLSNVFRSTIDKHDSSINDENCVLILPTCCGSLCKYLMVASGRASIFVQKARTQAIIKVWDHAVGVICVNEAGGKVSDWFGDELDFAGDIKKRRLIVPSGGVLVTNGILHNEIVKIITSHY